MKKLILIGACVGFMVSASFAQTKTSTSQSKSSSTAKMYYCPKCMASSSKAGECSKCHVKMVKEGDYYCPSCYATSSKSGKCAKCNMDMKQMTAAKSN